MIYNMLLPPANEVWGKVMFFTPVCHSVYSEQGVGFPACITGQMTSLQGVCFWEDFLLGGVCLQGGLLPRGYVTERSVSRGFCLQGVYLQRVCIRGSDSRGSSARGFCLQGGLHPRGLHPGRLGQTN